MISTRNPNSRLSHGGRWVLANLIRVNPDVSMATSTALQHRFRPVLVRDARDSMRAPVEKRFVTRFTCLCDLVGRCVCSDGGLLNPITGGGTR